MTNNIGYPIPDHAGRWTVGYKDAGGWSGVFGIFLTFGDAEEFFETLSEGDKTRTEVRRIGDE